MTSAQLEHAAAVVVAVALVMLGSAITAAPSLGLTDGQIALLGILSSGLGVVASVLPKIQARPERGNDAER